MLGIENRDHVIVNEDAQVTISEQVAQFSLQLGNGDLSAIGRFYMTSASPVYSDMQKH